MRHYIALIHKDADSDYGVSFPDLPGVITAGSDLDEVRKMAAEALAFHLKGWRKTARPRPNLHRWKETMMKRTTTASPFSSQHRTRMSKACAST